MCSVVSDVLLAIVTFCDEKVVLILLEFRPFLEHTKRKPNNSDLVHVISNKYVYKYCPGCSLLVGIFYLAQGTVNLQLAKT